MRAYGSIGRIGNEASHTKTAGLLLREGPEVDALHLAVDRVPNLTTCVAVSFARRRRLAGHALA